MLIPNVSQLDELPFLKVQKHKWVSEQEQGEKSRVRLLQHLRCMSYQCSSIMSKLFMFQKSTKKDTSNYKQHAQQFQSQQQEQLYEQLIVTTQKQIINLQKFYYLLNQTLPQQEFSRSVHLISVFTKYCKEYIRDQSMSRFEVDFGGREFLVFGVYMERGCCESESEDKSEGKSENKSEDLKENYKENVKQKSYKSGYRFFIKCSISSYTFMPFKDIQTPKHQLPTNYEITHPLVIQKLFTLYSQLQSLPLTITQKSITQYISYFDNIQFLIDQEYLKLQVFKNYPLLRSKYYLPVVFKDRITNERLDGPIFSNANAQCMFGHFYGYNADTIKVLEGNNCEQCHCLFEGVQQNPIMTHLRDNLFNPYKTDVIYCPQYNRFKLYRKFTITNTFIQEQTQQKQQPPPQFKSQITYLNYLHFRCNLKKTTTKRRNVFNQMLEYEKFPLTFELWGRRLMIMDPARGRNCAHYQFTDLRLIYLNKEDPQSNRCKCPICGDTIVDNDILYLREVQIIVKYLKFKCAKYKQFALTGYCFVDHRLAKVFIQFKKPNTQMHTTQTQIIEIKNLYQTLIDPYMSFNEYSLGIPDKYQQKLRNRYLFGVEEQNQDKNSDDQFQFRNGGVEDFQGQKLSKKISKMSVENEDQ